MPTTPENLAAAGASHEAEMAEKDKAIADATAELTNIRPLYESGVLQVNKLSADLVVANQSVADLTAKLTTVTAERDALKAKYEPPAPTPTPVPTYTVRLGQSIQSAVDAAKTGQAITIEPGLYAGQSVRIVGKTITLSAKGVTIDGSKGQKFGLYVDGPSTVDGLTVTGFDTNTRFNTLYDAGLGFAVQVKGGAKFVNGKSTKNVGTGVMMQGEGTVVDNCEISWNGAASYQIIGAKGGRFTNNRVFRNNVGHPNLKDRQCELLPIAQVTVLVKGIKETIQPAYRFDVGWDGPGKLAGATANTEVSGNDIYENYGTAVWTDMWLSGNRIVRNKVHDQISYDGKFTGTGIRLEIDADVLCEDNDVYDNGGNGIVVGEGHNFTVRNNRLKNDHIVVRQSGTRKGPDGVLNWITKTGLIEGNTLTNGAIQFAGPIGKSFTDYGVVVRNNVTN